MKTQGCYLRKRRGVLCVSVVVWDGGVCVFRLHMLCRHERLLPSSLGDAPLCLRPHRGRAVFFLKHRFHSISFTRAQGIPKYKIGFGREFYRLQ